MKVSREQMVENRRQILDVASRLFREKGFDAVSVSEVMKAAGFTHGGFYGHFSSKDDLVAQTITHALEGQKSGGAGLRKFVDILRQRTVTTQPMDARPQGLSLMFVIKRLPRKKP